MCGIFGWISRNGRVAPETVRRATTAIRHRGPDDEGFLFYRNDGGRLLQCRGDDTDPRIALPHVSEVAGERFDLGFGFRRLSIIDLSPAGHQPMASADGRLWIIFNGEIYNYRELREELTGLGHAFRSTSDTEVILAAYRQWGSACLDSFIGMWAFALWDREQETIFLARDRFGIKPLYFVTGDDSIAFASEIKALLTLPHIRPRLSAPAAFDYLRFALTDHHEGTLFEGVRQLQPGHSAVLSLRDMSLRPAPYWKPSTLGNGQVTLGEAARRVRELFEENIALHLRSDVPVGAALSGGVDSSAIVMSMRRVASGLDLRTFSFIANDAGVSEEKWVDIVGQASGAVVRKVTPEPGEITADLDRLIHFQDEPFTSTSIYAQHRVFRMAQESGVKVLLDGQGADELLAGYHMYLPIRLASLIRAGRLDRAARFAASAARLPGMDLRSLLLQAGGQITPRGFQRRLRQAVSKEVMAPWLAREWFESRGVSPSPPVEPRGPEYLKSHLYASLVRTSLPMLLRYEDRNSMAHSVESRVPFLTQSLVDYILGLPEEFVISDRATTKSVFRQAMRGIVPDVILDRRDKIGFATPERDWLIGLAPWVDSVLRSERARSLPLVDHSVVASQWDSVRSGGATDHRWLWRWIGLVKWADHFDVPVGEGA